MVVQFSVPRQRQTFLENASWGLAANSQRPFRYGQFAPEDLVLLHLGTTEFVLVLCEKTTVAIMCTTSQIIP